MSNKATGSVGLQLRLIALVLVVSTVGPSFGQIPDWRRVGNAAIDLDLAGLATGPVERAWYSPAGDRLSIRASSGKTFETSDFDRWIAAASDASVPPAPEGLSVGMPENGAQVRNPAGSS